MSKIWAFDGIENNHDVYRGKDCMNKFCKTLREYTMKIANFEENKKIPLTNEEYESYLNQRNCHFAKQSWDVRTLLIKIIVKLRTIVIILVITEVLHISYVI